MPPTPEQLVHEFHNGNISFSWGPTIDAEGKLDMGSAPKNAPEAAWLAIVELTKQPLTDQQVSVLAAGPLEDLLAYHGHAYIDRVMREARGHASFRRLLGGVWRNTIPEPVWRQILSICGPAS